MFLIFKSEVESTQVANGGSLNYPPTQEADLVYLSRVAHEWQLKLSTYPGGNVL